MECKVYALNSADNIPIELIIYVKLNSSRGKINNCESNTTEFRFKIRHKINTQKKTNYTLTIQKWTNELFFFSLSCFLGDAIFLTSNWKIRNASSYFENEWTMIHWAKRIRRNDTANTEAILSSEDRKLKFETSSNGHDTPNEKSEAEKRTHNT